MKHPHVEAQLSFYEETYGWEAGGTVIKVSVFEAQINTSLSSRTRSPQSDIMRKKWKLKNNVHLTSQEILDYKNWCGGDENAVLCSICQEIKDTKTKIIQECTSPTVATDVTITIENAEGESVDITSDVNSFELNKDFWLSDVVRVSKEGQKEWAWSYHDVGQVVGWSPDNKVKVALYTEPNFKDYRIDLSFKPEHLTKVKDETIRVGDLVAITKQIEVDDDVIFSLCDELNHKVGDVFKVLAVAPANWFDSTELGKSGLMYKALDDDSGVGEFYYHENHLTKVG